MTITRKSWGKQVQINAKFNQSLFLFRQEPVVYVNNKPFTARDPAK